MKKLIALAFSVFSVAVFAKSEVCDYSTDFNIKVNQQSVVFSKTDGKRLEFIDDYILIDGQKASLNSEQRKAAKQIHLRTKEMVPRVAEIAIEGAEIGLKAATIAVTTLFGGDEEAHKDLIAPLEKLSEKIKSNVSSEYLYTEKLESSIEQTFDQEFEQLVETAVKKHAGKMVGNILASIFSGDSEEIKDLEFRAENMERDIENYVEKHAADLEEKAEALCDDMQGVAEIDKQLMSVKGYPKEGLIQKGKKSGIKLNGFNFSKD